MRIAVFYGSTYGNTAEAATAIAGELSALLGVNVPLFDIAFEGVERVADYDVLVIGCSTWNIGQLQYDWELALDDLELLNLRGKRVAFFGAGDQVGYHDTFLDALGILADLFEARGAELVGSWPVAGYAHSGSLAQHGDRFVGLGLDYDNQEELNESRISRWCLALARELEAPGVLEDARLAPAS